jgi:hypothetical protein
MYISLYKLKPKPFSTTRSLFSFDRKKTVTRVQLFEIKVVPLQLKKSDGMRTIGAKKENGWLNFFKSAITEFSPESVKNYRRKRQKSPLSVLQNSRKYLKINDLGSFYPISTFAS